MESNPTFLTVVAAVIRDSAGRLLLQKCPPHKRHAGLWEFPGGKVEADEIPRLALCREVAEELGIALSPDALEPACFADEPADGARPALVLILYNCLTWRGEPEAREGQPWGWFTPAEAARLRLPPMDRVLLARLHPEVLS